MKTFFKWFLISFTGFIILLFGVAGLLNNKYSVERSISIYAPQDTVFLAVADLRTWQYWNPWFLVDSNMTSKIELKENFIGSSWEWDSQQIGKGKLTITDTFPYDSIRAKMKFILPKSSVVDEYWFFKKRGDSTIVTWLHKGDLEYPVGRILGLWSDNMLGPTFEEGLKLLKNYVEKK